MRMPLTCTRLSPRVTQGPARCTEGASVGIRKQRAHQIQSLGHPGLRPSETVCSGFINKRNGKRAGRLVLSPPSPLAPTMRPSPWSGSDMLAGPQSRPTPGSNSVTLTTTQGQETS